MVTAMKKWMIYYGDGSVFRDEDGLPLDAPKFGVQVIIQEDREHGRSTMFYYDYYLHYSDSDSWVGVFGHDGLVDHLAHNVNRIDAMVVGRMIPVEEFQAVQRAAGVDPYLPPTTAHRKGEHPGDY